MWKLVLMRCASAAVVLLAAPAAHASPSTNAGLLASQTRIALDAARHGHCDVVIQLAHQVEASADYYKTTFLADPWIESCVTTGTVTALPSAAAGATTARAEPDDKIPPANAGRFVGELVLGSLTALGGAYAGWRIGYASAGPCMGERETCDHNGIDEGVSVGAVGLVLGAPIGVYLVGTAGDETGSAAMTFGGSLAGAVAGVTLILVQPHDVGLGRLFLATAMPVLGATVGFHLSRRYDSPAVVPLASVVGGRAMFGLAGSF